jgi:DNA-directed RNA polymerase specialized sigma24 family protein
MWPPDDELLAAWRRLVADPDTAGAFAGAVLPPLEADLARQFRRADPHDVTTAAGDAVLAFLRRPETFDPAKGSLPGFLRLAARRDLINLLNKEKRHHRGQIPWEAVELTHPDRNDGVEVEMLADSPAVRAVVDALPEADRRVYDLMCDGERDTAVFATVLEIADRPADVQSDEVKRAKDRVKARLRRAGGVR